MDLVFKGGGSHKEGLLFKIQMTGSRGALDTRIFDKRWGYENKYTSGKRSRSCL